MSTLEDTTTPRRPRSRSGNRAATLADVAREAGVSSMTVSNVLNGRYKSSPHQESIMEAVRKLNYHLDPHAQRLASGFSPRLIGLLTQGIDLGVATLKIYAIQSQLAKRGFDVPLHVYGSSPERLEAEQLAMVRSVCRQRPQAVILNAASLSGEVTEELRAYQDGGGVIVCFDHPVDVPCDQVIFNNEENSYQATIALIRQGHRDIGFCNHGYILNAENDLPRLRGFRRALEEHGLRYHEAWIFYGPNYEAGGAHLARNFLDQAQRPTGLCIVNDTSAAVFVQQIMRAGLRVPDDVSVVGHDNLAPSEFCIVPLTTASHPVQEIADGVVDYLVTRLDASYQGPPRHTVLTGEIIQRESVGPPRAWYVQQ